MTELYQYKIHELLKILESGDIHPDEIQESLFKRISSEENKLGAFITLPDDISVKKVNDETRKSKSGFLHGIPIAIKDNICTKGILTSCASKILSNFIPPYDAHVIKRLEENGAIIWGKTNMDEFAMGSSTETSYYKMTKNPLDIERTPGGSSGGSAVSVASYMSPGAIGSDTGGSIRQPASFCGLVGMKPTYGRVSRYGLVAFAPSFDQIGPFARDVRDAAIILKAIAGYDKRDSTSINIDVPDYPELLEKGIKGKKVGVIKEFSGSMLSEELRDIFSRALKIFEDLGADVEYISLPHIEYGTAVYYVLSTAETSSNLARYDGISFGYRAKGTKDLKDIYRKTRSEGFGRETKRRIMLGTYILSAGYYDAYYTRAQKVRTLIVNDFKSAFEKVDYLVSPTTPSPAFRIGEKIEDTMSMYLSDIFTVASNIVGTPAISLPCGFSGNGMPYGLQIIGAQLKETEILQAAYAFEKSINLPSKIQS